VIDMLNRLVLNLTVVAIIDTTFATKPIRPVG
jgi:hypothetical protein